MLKVHHLKAATFCPVMGQIIFGENPLDFNYHVVAHVLLVETNDGLVLVDTGFGTDDVTRPQERFGPMFLNLVRPAFDIEETVLHQLKALGFKREDVCHIVPTHLDLDHAGALPDFPKAKVHIFRAEHEAAQQRNSLLEKERYCPHHWQHGPDWVKYDLKGESWNGLEAVKNLQGLPDDILLVPTTGHTRGHCAIAVNSQRGWMLHCGDAYFHRHEIRPDQPETPAGLEIFQTVLAVDNDMRKRNRSRLQQLNASKGGEVTIFSAHDPHEFAACRSHH